MPSENAVAESTVDSRHPQRPPCFLKAFAAATAFLLGGGMDVQVLDSSFPISTKRLAWILGRSVIWG